MTEFVIGVMVVAIIVTLWEVAERRGLRVPRIPFVSRAWEIAEPILFGLWAGLWATVIALAVLVSIAVSDALALAGAFVSGLVVFLIARALLADEGSSGGAAGYTDPRHEEAWRRVKAREYEEAAKLYRELAEPGDMVAMVNLANLLCDELDEPEEAARWYKRAVDLGSTTAAENLGLLYLDEGRVEEAREMFELARTRGGTTSYLGLAAIEYDDDHPRRARDLLEIAILEGDLEAYAPLGELLIEADELEDAEARLRHGVSLGAPGTAAVLRDLLEHLGRDQEASDLEELVEKQGESEWPPEATRD